MCLRTRKFSKTDGDIPKLCRGWHNRLLLATFFFQEWCERVNGKIIKSCLSLLPIRKCNIDLDRNINGPFKTCWGIRYSHDLKVVLPPPILFANYSRERLPSQGRCMMDFMSPDDEIQHHDYQKIRHVPADEMQGSHTPSRKCRHQPAIYSYHGRITKKNLRRNPGCGTFQKTTGLKLLTCQAEVVKDKKRQKVIIRWRLKKYEMTWHDKMTNSNPCLNREEEN